MPVLTYTTIDDPRANFRTDPFAINDAGTIVGTYVDLTGNHGFLYSGGTYTTLDAPGATGTEPSDRVSMDAERLPSRKRHEPNEVTPNPATPDCRWPTSRIAVVSTGSSRRMR